MLASAALAEVVGQRLRVLEGSRGICPEVGPVCLAIARFEHGHRRLVGMQHAVLQQLGPQGIDQWLQRHAAGVGQISHASMRQAI